MKNSVKSELKDLVDTLDIHTCKYCGKKEPTSCPICEESIFTTMLKDKSPLITCPECGVKFRLIREKEIIPGSYGKKQKGKL